ncbi:restriction endonuclease subunit S [Lactiplantibacillus plantarum]|uniref:restriction endonuclease subunit S n=1 Tax=Lactiplantibacillus plantarum TaxID=1590 RepID=UPI0009782E89|nr:restriction endonuclease subunit S [Lactiplantibacillus plantarum]
MENKRVKLEDVCRVSSSKRIFAREYVEIGVPFWRGKEVTEHATGKSSVKGLFISSQRYKELTETGNFPEEGDILVTAVGTIGSVYQIRYDDLPLYFKDGNIIRLSNWDTKLVNSAYVSLYLRSKIGQQAIEEVEIGSTQKALTIKDVEKIIISIPEIKVQNKIVSIVETIDSKIELNRHINKNLLKLNDVLFDRMVNDGSVTSKITLSELGLETLGGDWGKAEITDSFSEAVDIIRGADLEGLVVGNREKVPTRFVKITALKKKRLVPNDIVIEISGGSPTQSTGRTAYVKQGLLNSMSNPVLGTNFTRTLRMSNSDNSDVALGYFRYLYSKGFFFNYENGTTGIKNLDYKAVLNIKLKDVRESFLYSSYHQLVDTNYNRIYMLGEQNRALIQLRDCLLPKLLAGDINLSNIETVMNNA